jgi:hypothetical protein
VTSVMECTAHLQYAWSPPPPQVPTPRVFNSWSLHLLFTRLSPRQVCPREFEGCHRIRDPWNHGGTLVFPAQTRHTVFVPETDPPFPGSLCHRCEHKRDVKSARAWFLRCVKLEAKYAPQPVRVCAAFSAAAPEAKPSEE